MTFRGRMKLFFRQAAQARNTRGFLWTMRYLGRYAKFSKSNLSSLETALPWFSFPAIDLLEKILRKDFRIFEFGSGASSLFFSKRVHSVNSVEHDKQWYERMRMKLEVCGITNVRCELREPEDQDSVGSPIYESVTFASVYDGKSFKHYCTTIDGFPNEYFDLIVIDGRARVAAFAHAFSKIRPGGYFLIDNSDRPSYNAIREQLLAKGWRENELWGPGPYSEYFWQTSIWDHGES